MKIDHKQLAAAIVAENEATQRAKQGRFNTIANIGIALVVIVVLELAAIRFFRPDILDGPAPSPALPTAQLGNVGGQAPPQVRGVYQERAAPIPGIAQNEATAQVEYQRAVDQTEPTPAVSNSEGAPVISQQQQAQMDLAGDLAAQEAAQAQLDARRADAAARPPDVSYEDAKALLGRDPCHVPRADPVTCSQGLFKPTPPR